MGKIDQKKYAKLRRLLTIKALSLPEICQRTGLLPRTAQRYIQRLSEELLGTGYAVYRVSMGPDRWAIVRIVRRVIKT